MENRNKTNRNKKSKKLDKNINIKPIKEQSKTTIYYLKNITLIMHAYGEKITSK